VPIRLGSARLLARHLRKACYVRKGEHYSITSSAFVAYWSDRSKTKEETLMSKTVVGLFDSARDAQDVASDLRDLGLGSTDVDLVTQDAFGGSQSDMLNIVTGAGIPSSDARLYVEGVRRGGALVIAQTDDSQVNDVVSVMNRHNIVDIESRRDMYATTDTDVDADVTRATLSTSGTTGAVDTTYSGTSTTGTTGTRNTQVNTGDEIAVPIVEEEIRVGKREVEKGGVRVNTRVEEVPVEEQVRLRDEEVHVERRRVDQPVDNIDAVIKEGTFEVRETDEEAVTSKQARVVEEVVISKDVQERTETVQDTVRRTDVDIEQVPGQTRTSGYTTSGTTGTTGTSGGLTDRIEGATGLDIDRDGDAGGRKRR
jgi:stress response protein YsnF